MAGILVLMGRAARRSFVGLAHNSTHLFIVDVADMQKIRSTSTMIPLKLISSVVSGEHLRRCFILVDASREAEGGRYLKIRTQDKALNELNAFLNIAVEDYDMQVLTAGVSDACESLLPQELARFMASLEKHSTACREAESEHPSSREEAKKDTEERERERPQSGGSRGEGEEEQPTLALVDDGTRCGLG
eukprot:762497-Hanusia_phi.AAC.11